jgi:hypothetical protein
MTIDIEGDGTDRCISVKKPAHQVVIGDYVRLAGPEFDRVIGIAVLPDGTRQLRFREYQASLPADRVVDTY